MTLAAAVDVLETRRDELGERSQAAVDLLGMEVDRFRQLVEDLLEMSRYDAGAVRLELDDIRLAEFVMQAVKISTNGDSVPVDLDSELAGVVVQADKRRLARVVANLLDNARKYGDGATSVVLATGRRRRADRGRGRGARRARGGARRDLRAIRSRRRRRPARQRRRRRPRAGARGGARPPARRQGVGRGSCRRAPRRALRRRAAGAARHERAKRAMASVGVRWLRSSSCRAGCWRRVGSRRTASPREIAADKVPFGLLGPSTTTRRATTSCRAERT